MKTVEYKLTLLPVLMLGLALQTFAASSWPMYFENVGTRGADGSYTKADSALMDTAWNELMKYKLWGTHKLDFSNNTISIADDIGYNGTADGSMVVKNQKHHLGGPTLIGGNLSFENSSADTISGGPVRVVHDLQISLQQNNVMEGNWCVGGTISSQYNDGSLNAWDALLTGYVYNDGYTLTKKAGDYADCPASVPALDTNLIVPVWPEPDSWEPAIQMTSCSPEDYFIHVPPDSSVVESERGMYDLYTESINVTCTNNKHLYILMPPGGKLTRIYSRDGFNFQNAVNNFNVQVVYVKKGTVYNKSTQKWDLTNFNEFDKVNNSDYAGDLLFYTQKDIKWNYWVNANFQGSWMSAGTISLAGHFKLAGQVLATNLEFEHDIQGDFRYVPFDPPEIDPSLFAGREYVESDKLDTVPFKLSKTTLTDVKFKYCYSFIDHIKMDFDTVKVDDEIVRIDTTITDTCRYSRYGMGGCADPVDLLNPDGDLPICGIDTGLVLIPRGSLVPTDSANMAWIRVKVDSLVEPDEYMNLNIIDLKGAVIKYGDVAYFNSTISVGIKLKNIDDPNHSPKFDDSCDTLNVTENVNGDLAGIISATDDETSVEDLTYFITNDESGLFVMDENTGVVKLKDGVAVDYEAKQVYVIEITVYDKDGGFTAKNFGVRVNDVNESPTIENQTLPSKVREDKKTGAVVGQLVRGDIDSLNAKTVEREFVKHNICEVVGGDTAIFAMDSASGFITIKNGDLIDYESDSVLTLDVRVRDTSVYVIDAVTGERTYPLEAYATVTINVGDVDDGPVIDDTSKVIIVGDDTLKNIVNLDKRNQGAVDENNPADVIVGAVRATCTDTTKKLIYEISKDTSGLFTIDPNTGVVSVKDPMVFDYERVDSYEITVVVSDGVVVDTDTGKDAKGYVVQTATRDVVIRVIDLDESPIVGPQDFDAYEEKDVGSVVGKVVSADMDSAASKKIHIYSAVGGDTTLFKIDEDGTIRNKEVLDYETRAATGDTVFTLVVKVTDKNPAKDGSELFAIDTMTIVLKDANEPPHITTDTVTVAENSESGSVVDTLEAVDEDGDDEKLVFELVGTSEYVEVDSNGVITVKKDADIDYEEVQYTTITVKVTDAGGVSETKEITVKIDDVNEPPSVSDQSFSVKEDVDVGTEVGKVKASDPDTKNPEYGTLTYKNLTETDKFEVLSDGTIKLIDNLDYEKDSVYTLKVEVTDGTYTDVATVTIKVGNVLEKSTVEITKAENPEKCWDKSGKKCEVLKDTIYTNLSELELEWKACGGDTSSCKLMKGDTTLTEGKNIIIKTFKDPTTDEEGADTLIVFLSTSTPIVTVSKTTDPDFDVNIYTIEEQVDAKDSAIFFVNTKDHEVAVTVEDPVTKSKDSFTVKLKLDTVSVPSKTFDTMGAIADATLPLKENPSGAVRTPINGEKIAVSYQEIFAGDTVTVTYYTNMDGDILKGESGEEEMTVSYTKVIGGKEVKISFQADAATGHALESADGGIYTISYDYEDKQKNSVNVAYTVNEKGKMVKNSSGDVGYEVSYTYVNQYGNSATKSLSIVLDTKLPLVWIKTPTNDQVLTSNMAEVEWYVSATGDSADFVLQDTLRVQGLEKGANTIVRFFVDKAGNMAADTVYVIMKDAKDVEIAVEKPVTFADADRVAEYYGDDNAPEEGQTFAVSIKNPKTDKEVETKVGGSFKTKDGSGSAPYPGHNDHLGPTLGIDVKLPVYNSVGGLATLDDLVGKDGLVNLEGVDAANGKKMSVEEYTKEYCTEEFASSYGKDISKANLYNTKMKVKIWVFTTLGSFVDYFTFTQELNDPDFVDEAGLLNMYFEMKPDKEGYVRTENGRLYSTGAYVYKTEVELKSELSCTLPPVQGNNPNQKKGAVRKTSDDLLKPFGYKRPNSKKK